MRQKISLCNISYKQQADLHRLHIAFEVGDQVMVRVRLERFQTNKYRKLQYRSVRTYKILKKITSNAYVLDLPDNIGISSIFNIEDLNSLSRSHDAYTEEVAAARLPPVSNVRDEIEDIVDTNIVSTRGGGYQKYLMKWKNRPWSNCTGFQRKNSND